jgi:hypothetical protein
VLESQKLQPEKVTRPIQLLAAWLVGLVVIDGIFLEVAVRLEPGSWERSGLVVAAILNVPAFLAALFTLQTRFRAELQDDVHYAQYLSKKTAEAVALPWADDDADDIDADDDEAAGDVASTADPATLDWSRWRVAINAQLPRYAEILAALRAARIPVAEVFGHAPAAGGEPPANRVVSLSRALPAAHQAALLRALLPFGFDGFQVWNPVRDADEDEDVYIGSYGARTYAPMDAGLARLLADGAGAADLEAWRRSNEVRAAA